MRPRHTSHVVEAPPIYLKSAAHRCTCLPPRRSPPRRTPLPLASRPLASPRRSRRCVSWIPPARVGLGRWMLTHHAPARKLGRASDRGAVRRQLRGWATGSRRPIRSAGARRGSGRGPTGAAGTRGDNGDENRRPELPLGLTSGKSCDVDQPWRPVAGHSAVVGIHERDRLGLADHARSRGGERFRWRSPSTTDGTGPPRPLPSGPCRRMVTTAIRWTSILGERRRRPSPPEISTGPASSPPSSRFPSFRSRLRAPMDRGRPGPCAETAPSGCRTPPPGHVASATNTRRVLGARAALAFAGGRCVALRRPGRLRAEGPPARACMVAR